METTDVETDDTDMVDKVILDHTPASIPSSAPTTVASEGTLCFLKTTGRDMAAGQGADTNIAEKGHDQQNQQHLPPSATEAPHPATEVEGGHTVAADIAWTEADQQPRRQISMAPEGIHEDSTLLPQISTGDNSVDGSQSSELRMSLGPEKNKPDVDHEQDTDAQRARQLLPRSSSTADSNSVSLRDQGPAANGIEEVGPHTERPQSLAPEVSLLEKSSAASEEGVVVAQNVEEAEWEIDSSPIDSSSTSDTNSDTSSIEGDDNDEKEEEEEGEDYTMLDPEEQARILMQGDGGSDDEGNARSGKRGEAAQPRTTNEKPEEVVPKPNINVTEDMKVEELGNVEAIVENTVLVKAKVSGEYRVLENNSLLCLQDRSVVGVVSETLGRVQQPLYTIRFTNAEAIKEAGLSQKDTPVYYVQDHSTFVFTQPLRAVRGSDASNFHDEEVEADEMEFSDDEAEAEHKRQMKLKRQGRKDEKTERSGHQPRGRGRGRTSKSTFMHGDVNGNRTTEINYDDIPPMGDEGYRPLARPANLQEMMGSSEPPLEGRPPPPASPQRGSDRGRGRGRGRGQGQGRGDRGHRGGRGAFGRGGRDRNGTNAQCRSMPPFTDGHKTSPISNNEPFPSPQTSTIRQQVSSPTFPLPQIPLPSQSPYPPFTPRQNHHQPPPAPFPSYQYSTPPQAPVMAPQQPSSYPNLFSPSPISALPPNLFSFNSTGTTSAQGPYGSSHGHHPPPSPLQSQPYQPPQNYYQHQPQPQPHQPSHHPHTQQQNWRQQSPYEPYPSHMHNNHHHHHHPDHYSPSEPLVSLAPQPQSQPQQQSQPQPDMPPPGSHINPAFLDTLKRQEGG